MPGARALAAALNNNATLKELRVSENDIGTEGAHALADALDANRTLLELYLDNIEQSVTYVTEDRLHLNTLIADGRMTAWAEVRRWDPERSLPPDLAARAVMLAFGDELLDQVLPETRFKEWLSPGGRKFAADYLMPRAEAALRARGPL